MSVTELHRSPDDRRVGEAGQPAATTRHPRHTPSIAVLIVDHAPDPADLGHLYDDFEVVLIVHDTGTAASLLEGISRPGSFGTPHVPDAAPPAEVTPLFDAGLLGLALDDHHLATWQGRLLPLTDRERLILACLLGAPGQVWTYRELFEAAWGGCYLGDPALVHSALKRIRRKMRDAGVGVSIDAVRGVGFRAVGAD